MVMGLKYWCRTWLGIKNDYRTLIGLDALDIIEKEDDEEDEENSDA